MKTDYKKQIEEIYKNISIKKLVQRELKLEFVIKHNKKPGKIKKEQIIEDYCNHKQEAEHVFCNCACHE